VHGFYNAVGTGLTWPFRTARNLMKGEPESPWEAYRAREWSSILETVEKAYERLEYASELGDELLADRLRSLLDGLSRTELLQRLEAAHAEVDLQRELEELVDVEMRTFREESPQSYAFLKRIDQAAAVARPVTSVALFVTGFGPAGDVAAHLVTDAALQSMVHVVGDVTGGTVAATVGETALSSTAAGGAGYVEAKFRRLQSAFTARRVSWLLRMLDEHVWGQLLGELQANASIPHSEAVAAVEAHLRRLRAALAEEPSAEVTPDRRAT
jgi:hypothetical protein